MSDFLNKYPYTDFHELNLDWVIERVKKLTEDWLATLDEWHNTQEEWQQLYDYVHDYFDNLDVQQEINNKINAMIADGTFVQITTPVIEAKVASMMPGTVADQIGDVVASQIGGTVSSQIGAAVASQVGPLVNPYVTSWLDDHITQPTTPAIDTSLSVAGAAADAAKTGALATAVYDSTLMYDKNDYVLYNGDLYRAKQNITAPEAWTASHWKQISLGKSMSSVEQFIDRNTTEVQTTEDCTYTTNAGFMDVAGTIYAYSNYSYTSNIKVNEGDLITGTFAGTGLFRVVTAFSGATAVSADGASNVTDYTVPAGIDSIVITYYGSGVTAIHRTYPQKQLDLDTSFEYIVKSCNPSNWSHDHFSIANDTYESDESFQDEGEYVISFFGNITSFNQLIVAHGYNAYMGGYIKVTNTDISYYAATEGTARYSASHGLNIVDYVGLIIKQTVNRISVYLYTNGGSYEMPEQNSDIRNGTISVIADSTTSLSGCNVSYCCQGWKKKNHLYGDSYFGPYTNKWTRWLRDTGTDENNYNDYPGRGSATALLQVKMILNYSNPSRIIWCMGMNDGDVGSVNTNWKNAVDELMTICESKNIELILATIPNVPTVDNTYKNAYVQSSGLRYIDFAAAVGAANDTTWYTGMLSDDNVHPTEAGAICLFNAAVSAVPELLNK